MVLKYVILMLLIELLSWLLFVLFLRFALSNGVNNIKYLFNMVSEGLFRVYGLGLSLVRFSHPSSGNR